MRLGWAIVAVDCSFTRSVRFTSLFLTSGLYCSQENQRSAHLRVTQAVRRSYRQRTQVQQKCKKWRSAMRIAQVLSYIGIWSVIGCIIFSLFVVIIFRTGIVWAARNQDGKLKKRIPLSGFLAMLTVLFGIIGLQLLSNYVGLRCREIELAFWPLFLLNYGYYAVLFLYDTLVIDFLVLSLWRPNFLQIPDVMSPKSLKEHIILSIPRGFVAGAILTAVSTVISYFTFLQK